MLVRRECKLGAVSKGRPEQGGALLADAAERHSHTCLRKVTTHGDPHQLVRREYQAACDAVIGRSEHGKLRQAHAAARRVRPFQFLRHLLKECTGDPLTMRRL